MAPFMSVSQVILRAVLGNIVRNAVGGFVRDYRVHRLVFVEFHETMADAILREKRIKKWRRTWKLELIERHNRQCRDLYEGGRESAPPVHARVCPWRKQGKLWAPLSRGQRLENAGDLITASCAGSTNRVECRTLIFATRYSLVRRRSRIAVLTIVTDNRSTWRDRRR